MHPFMLVGGLLHATAVLVIAFFVWFAAARATGPLRLLGIVLGWWLVVVAVVGIVFAASGRGHHMGPWMGHEAPPAAAGNTTP